MKKVLIFIIVSLLLFSLVSAKIGMTSRATDEECIDEGGTVNFNFWPTPLCCEGLNYSLCDSPGIDNKCEYGCMEISYCTKCGDGQCKSPENKCNCPKDCGGAICGNGICEEREANSEQMLRCSSDDQTYCKYNRCDEDCDETEDDKVCCSILVIYPDAVPTYQMLKRSECVNEKDGEPIVGAYKEIVDDSFCENDNSDEDETCEQWTCTQWGACISGTRTRNCVQDNTCSVAQETPKTSKKCDAKEKIGVNKKSTECPEKCTCTGSVTKCWLANGTREMTIHAGKSGNIIVQVKGVNASTNVTLYKSDDGKLYGVFKGNKTRIIKMLPDQVKEKIRERLQRQLEDEKIELSEDGTYLYQAKNKARLFAVFPVKVKVVAEVNSETGEVIKFKKAWWAFLAKEEGDLIVGASCGTVTPGYNDECCVNKGYDLYNTETGECEFNSTE